MIGSCWFDALLEILHASLKLHFTQYRDRYHHIHFSFRMRGRGVLIVATLIAGLNGKKWSMDPTSEEPSDTPIVSLEPAVSVEPVVSVEPIEPVDIQIDIQQLPVMIDGIVVKLQNQPSLFTKQDPPAQEETGCTMGGFLRVKRAESRRWCRSLDDLDRSKEATVNLIAHFMSRMELVGGRNEDSDMLTLRIDPDIFASLSAIALDDDSDLVVNEMFETIDNLFLPIPADDRSPLIKLLDHVGIELVHFQAACAITVVLMALITLRKYGFGFLQHFGLTVLLKYGFLLAWLLNMPLAYLNELESEKAKWKVAKISPVPEGCAGQEMSTWTAVKGWFSFSQIKNHCDKWQQVKRFILFSLVVCRSGVGRTYFSNILSPPKEGTTNIFTSVNI